MSAAAQTKIFGFRIGVDPKILVGGLIAFAVLLFWYNSRGEDETGGAATGANRSVATPTATVPLRPRIPVRRGIATAGDRNTLRLRPVDATRGDVDPTLRLDLLDRLQSVKPEESGRNLFEVGPPPMSAEDKARIEHAPQLPPKPVTPPAPVVTGPPPLNIPLQYYGFVKDGEKGESRRGLFLDGDNVLVASEGEVLKQHYLVVELTATGARIEDVQLKQGKTLPVVPVAVQ